MSGASRGTNIRGEKHRIDAILLFNTFKSEMLGFFQSVIYKFGLCHLPAGIVGNCTFNPGQGFSGLDHISRADDFFSPDSSQVIHIALHCRSPVSSGCRSNPADGISKREKNTGSDTNGTGVSDHCMKAPARVSRCASASRITLQPMGSVSMG